MPVLTIAELVDQAKPEKDLLDAITKDEKDYTEDACRKLALNIIDHKTDNEDLQKKLAAIAEKLFRIWLKRNNNQAPLVPCDDKQENVFCAILRGDNPHLVNSYAMLLFASKETDPLTGKNLLTLLFEAQASFINAFINCLSNLSSTKNLLGELRGINANKDKYNTLTGQHIVTLVEKLVAQANDEKNEALKKELKKIAIELYCFGVKNRGKRPESFDIIKNLFLFAETADEYQEQINALLIFAPWSKGGNKAASIKFLGEIKEDKSKSPLVKNWASYALERLNLLGKPPEEEQKALAEQALAITEPGVIAAKQKLFNDVRANPQASPLTKAWASYGLARTLLFGENPSLQAKRQALRCLAEITHSDVVIYYRNKLFNEHLLPTNKPEPGLVIEVLEVAGNCNIPLDASKLKELAGLSMFGKRRDDQSLIGLLALVALCEAAPKDESLWRNYIERFNNPSYVPLAKSLSAQMSQQGSPEERLGRTIQCLEDVPNQNPRSLAVKYLLIKLYQQSGQQHLIAKIEGLYWELAEQIIALRIEKPQNLPEDYAFVCIRVAEHFHSQPQQAAEAKEEKGAAPQQQAAVAPAQNVPVAPADKIFTTQEAEKLILEKSIAKAREKKNDKDPNFAEKLYFYGQLIEQQDNGTAYAYFQEAERLGHLKALIKILDVYAEDTNYFSVEKRIELYKTAIPTLLTKGAVAKANSLLEKLSRLAVIQPNRNAIEGFIRTTRENPQLTAYQHKSPVVLKAIAEDNVDKLLELTSGGNLEAHGHLQILALKQNCDVLAALNIYHLQCYRRALKANRLSEADAHLKSAGEYASALQEARSNPSNTTNVPQQIQQAVPAPNAPPAEREQKAPADALVARTAARGFLFGATATAAAAAPPSAAAAAAAPPPPPAQDVPSEVVTQPQSVPPSNNERAARAVEPA